MAIEEKRYHELLEYRSEDNFADLTRDDYVIVSYSDDEGVCNNSGRAGAATGPERILHFLGRLPVHHKNSSKLFVLKEEESISSLSLKERHQKAEEKMLELFNRGCRVISLGGGHDYGYPDASAYYQVFKSSILNVDAHLDVRECDLDKINSGTPFYRFAERFGGKAIVQWGIQKSSNSKKLFDYARKKEMSIYGWREPMPKLEGRLGLSICLDAFEGIRGVSAPAVVGLSKSLGIDLIQHYSKDQSWLGIYECAPALDPQTEDSARFAARLIWEWIEAQGESA